VFSFVFSFSAVLILQTFNCCLFMLSLTPLIVSQLLYLLFLFICYLSYLLSFIRWIKEYIYIIKIMVTIMRVTSDKFTKCILFRQEILFIRLRFIIYKYRIWCFFHSLEDMCSMYSPNVIICMSFKAVGQR